jgi:PAS domain S-box-containing protein
MRFPQKLSHQIILLVMVPIAIELAFISYLFYLSKQIEAQLEEEVRGRNLISTINDFHNCLTRGVETMGSFIQNRDKEHVAIYKQYVENGETILQALKTRMADKPTQLAKLVQIEQLFGKTQGAVNELISSVENGQGELVIATQSVKAKSAGNAVLEALNDLGSREQTELDKKTVTLKQQREANQNALFMGILLNVVMAIGASILVTGKLTQRLGQLSNNSQKIAAGQSLPPPMAGQDEIAQLDQVLHATANALQQMMQKQRSILDNTSEVICSVSDANVVTAINPAAKHVWGYSEDELIGSRCISIVHSDDVQSTLDAFARARQEGTHSFENRIVKPDGTPFSMQWSARWVDEEKSLFCVVHDISARKQLEELKQELINIVSHDLRSPLHSLQLKLQMLANGARGSLSQEAKDEVSRAEKNVEQMIRLTNDLLDLEKLESGQWLMHFRKRTLLSILNEAVLSIQSLSEDKRVTVNLPSEDFIFVADGDRMTQVVINILANAIKYSPEAQTIDIAAKEIGGQLEVRITDHGPGIAIEDQKVIFERFRQASRPDAESGGTGLGLSICKLIVKAHGGTIGVESDGKGSTFWFRIPIEQQSTHAIVTSTG